VQEQARKGYKADRLDEKVCLL